MTAPAPWPERPWPAAVPRFATPRNEARPTLGHELVEVARLLGYEPMPWMVSMWDTMYEYEQVDDVKKLYYREIRRTVPRQSAKTTASLIEQVHRMLYGHRHGWGTRPVSAFTAQHASDARDKMVNEWMPVVEYSDLVGELLGGGIDKGFLRSNGKESIKWANGGRMVTFPPNATGAHGQTLDIVVIDEAFAFPDNRAEQGARHAQITRKSPQIVIQSTAGTAESTYLKEKVDDGRRRVLAGDCGHVYYLEYSVGPEDDIDNPAHWPRFMPALGYTIDIEAVTLEHDTLDPDEFFRAYGNGWTGSSNQIIPAAAWAKAYAPKTPRTGKVWMAVDVSPGQAGQGRSASIAVASWRGAEIHTEVIAYGPGTAWVADKIGELTRLSKTQLLYVDLTGPIKQILPDIKLKSMAKIELVDSPTMAAACGRFHQGVMDQVLRHRDQDVLNAAVQGADKRTLDDQWAWKRRTSTSDISPLVAATLASWGAAISGDRGAISMHTG